MCTLLVLLIWTPGRAQTPVEDDVESDEHVIFFPTIGTPAPDRDAWHVHVHGWIFEPERESVVRDAVTELAASHFEKEVMTAPRRRRFDRRLRYFIVDNEGGKQLTISIAGKRLLLPESDGDGRFETRITLSSDRIRRHGSHRELTYSVLQKTVHGDRTFGGTVHLMEQRGILVISDIDDTIKVSSVRNRTKLLRNTFLKPYMPVAGMAATYRRWSADPDVDVLYLSSSPWQLYPPLRNFMRTHRFPPGPVDLLRFQLDDTRITRLFDRSMDKKWSRLKRYLKQFSKRRIILVGETGERDPEIYGRAARSYPDRVEAVYLRNVTDGDPASTRYRDAFRAVPDGVWQLFDEPTELRLPDEPRGSRREDR